MQTQPSSLPWLGPLLPGAELASLASADMSGQFGTGAELVPKCLGSEMSWVRSVLTPIPPR